MPGVPLGAWTPLPELMEEVRDLFMMDSSASEVIPLFRLPGLEEGRESITTLYFKRCYGLHSIEYTQTVKLKGNIGQYDIKLT